MNPGFQKYAAAVLSACMLGVPAALHAQDKVQKITFIEDDAQKNMASKIYTLKYTRAADIAPFIRSAAFRYTKDSHVSTLVYGQKQMIIVSTGINLIPYIDKLITALDRNAKFDITGDGIAVGVYHSSFRATDSMLNVIVKGDVSSGDKDSLIRLDKKRNMFYFKDTPATVDDIKAKLAWLDKPVPQARIELTVYEVRDSDLKDIGIDYLGWKNGPGLNLFGAGYDALSARAAEKVFDFLGERAIELAGGFTYGFGGFYTAPAFDMSFIRLLQQNGKATVSSTASLLISNAPGKEFKVEFAPEYQNITKDDDHSSSVGKNQDTRTAAQISDAVITAGKSGLVNFKCAIENSNVVERNNMGVELTESEFFTTFASLAYNQEHVIAGWNRTNTVEQTIGIPFLCELPVLKYIFGTTTENTEVTRYIITARAIPAVYNENVAPGAVAEFDKVSNK